MLTFIIGVLITLIQNQILCQADERPHIVFFLADDLGKSLISLNRSNSFKSGIETNRIGFFLEIVYFSDQIFVISFKNIPHA